MAKKTTYKKGIELEERFAQYVKEEMGYTETKIRFQVKQANNSRGANVDVIGQKLTDTGKLANTFSYVYMGIALIFIVIGIYFLTTDDLGVGGAFLLLGLISEIIGFIFIVVNNKTRIANIWVECKNLKNKVNISQVRKMIDEIKAYKNSEDKKYKFKEFAFVSASGFIDNAIELAIANNIKCFIVNDNNEFQQITEWSN